MFNRQRILINLTIMTTIKSYTDISQSKKLLEILPIESADMWYQYAGISIKDGSEKSIYFPMVIRDCKSDKDIPCWSLSALLSVLPDEITDDGDVYRNMVFHLKGKYIIQYPRLTTLWPSLLSVEADNVIDACVEMIIKLYELKML